MARVAWVVCVVVFGLNNTYGYIKDGYRLVAMCTDDYFIVLATGR